MRCSRIIFLVTAGVLAVATSMASGMIILVAPGIGLMVGILGALESRARFRRASERADGYERLLRKGAAVLAPGAIVLHGRVAYAKHADRAMRLDIIQVGSESESSGTWSHQWTEVERRLTVSPFYLVQEHGSESTEPVRVRVEPQENASQLFDELENKVLVRNDPSAPEQPRRERHATLLPEEEVWIAGQLERDVDPEAIGAEGSHEAGYRHSAQMIGWVVRGAPTLLVSSMPLVDHFRARARLHRRQMIALLVAALFPLLVFGYLADRALGDIVLGTVVDRVDTYSCISHDFESYDCSGERYAIVRAGASSWSTRDWSTHDMTTPGAPSVPALGAQFSVRVGRLSSNDGEEFHIVRHGERVASYLGSIVCLFVLFMCAFYATRTLPWYRRSRQALIESGDGRLPRVSL